MMQNYQVAKIIIVLLSHDMHFYMICICIYVFVLLKFYNSIAMNTEMKIKKHLNIFYTSNFDSQVCIPRFNKAYYFIYLIH